MSNIIKSFSYKSDKESLIETVEEAGKKEGLKFSEVIIESLEEWAKKHAKSNNPQTELGQFDKENILAVPNIYREEEAWKKFYSLIKKKEDFKEVDKALNMILNIHNKEFKKF